MERPPLRIDEECTLESLTSTSPSMNTPEDTPEPSCSYQDISTAQLPSTPGLDVWVDGISHEETLELLGLGIPPSSNNTTASIPDLIPTRALLTPLTVLNYLLSTAPNPMHLQLNGEMRSSQVVDISEDYAILRAIASASSNPDSNTNPFSSSSCTPNLSVNTNSKSGLSFASASPSQNRYWILNIHDIHCSTCLKTMRNQARQDEEAILRLASRAKGAWRHRHCVEWGVHGICGCGRRPHNVLSRLGIETTHKIKYLRLTSSSSSSSSSPYPDPSLLGSAITVLKPFISQLEGLELEFSSSSSSSFSSSSHNNNNNNNSNKVNHRNIEISRQEARRLICCFIELESLLEAGKRLKITGLNEYAELENMWWGVRRKWWVGRERERDRWWEIKDK